MKKLSAVFLAAALLVTLPAAADDNAAIAQAESVVTVWLAKSDQGQYADTYDASSSMIKQQVSKAEWLQGMQSARTPFGAVLSRTVKTASYTHSIPGAPDGEYVVIRFNTTFANKANAIETVTPVKEADGTWRIAGYFIN